MLNKIIFLDRDGTLIDEPEDKQVDSLKKVNLKNNVISALLSLKKAGYQLVMISNQDGMGSAVFPEQDFNEPQKFLLTLLKTQGIEFDSILICPHFESDQCQCRKPKLGLVMNYLREGTMDFSNSYVIGDRKTDLELANNLGIQGILYHEKSDWLDIAKNIISKPRRFEAKRMTSETNITAAIDLDECRSITIKTGIGFLDHMIEQLAKHGGFGLTLQVNGDLQIDEHHTVEDTALTIGEALRKALGDKLGIARYGFILPMDEAKSEVAIDLSGRSFFVFDGKFTREKIGELPTELISHFFQSLSISLGATIHIKVTGENTHHMIESIFKGVGRALRQAMTRQGFDLPSTKGCL